MPLHPLFLSESDRYAQRRLRGRTRIHRSRRELARLPERVIFNCTGLGSRELFGDEELIPVRGQLEVLLPQPEIDYCYLSSGYMFPRRDGIILGGTWDHDDWSLTPNAEQANGILQTHTNIMKNLVAPAL